MRNPNRRTDPLRRIVKREIQNGRPFVVLVCGHASPGVPANGRYSYFYPCVICAGIVEERRRLEAAATAEVRDLSAARAAAQARPAHPWSRWRSVGSACAAAGAAILDGFTGI